MKKFFILYNDMLEVLDELTDEQAGKLFKTIRAYQQHLNNHLDPQPQEIPPFPVDDFVTRIAFASFKAQFNREAKQWHQSAVNNRKKGRMGNLKRWHPDIYNKVVAQELSLEEAEEEARSKKARPSKGKETKKEENIAEPAHNSMESISIDQIVPYIPKKRNTYWEIKPIEALKEEYLSNERLTQVMFKILNINDKQQLSKLLCQFHEHLESQGEYEKDIRDYCSHFKNWIRKRKQEEAVEKQKKTEEQAQYPRYRTFGMNEHGQAVYLD